MAYAVLSASSRFATPKTNVETDLALFLSLTARCVRVAPPGALDSVGEAIARRLALPESTSRRNSVALQRSNGGRKLRPRPGWMAQPGRRRTRLRCCVERSFRRERRTCTRFAPASPPRGGPPRGGGFGCERVPSFGKNSCSLGAILYRFPGSVHSS